MPEKYFSERFGFSKLKSMKDKRRFNSDFERALLLEIFDIVQANGNVDDQSLTSYDDTMWFWETVIININKFFLLDEQLLGWTNNGYNGLRRQVEAYFSGLNWHERMSFIEIISDSLRSRNQIKPANDFMRGINKCCTRFDFDWRWLNLEVGFIKVVDEHEKVEVEQAIKLLRSAEQNGAARHLESAIQHLSDFTKPNFRASANESISALESYMRVATGANGIGAARKELSKKFGLPQGMTRMINDIFSYSNDTDGAIRHANLGGVETTEAEARLFLIQCSSWINYLKTLKPSDDDETISD